MPAFITNKNIQTSDSRSVSSDSLPSKPSFKKDSITRFFQGPVSDQNRADFFDHLATLLASGITLIHALEYIQDSIGHPKLKFSVSKISTALRGGDSFSEAVAREYEIFDLVSVGMLKAAESSGRLGTVCLELAGAYSRRAEVQNQILQAVSYPILVAVFGLLTVLVLLIFVIPKIASVFELWEMPLPWTTRVLLGVSHFLRTGTFFLFLAVFSTAGFIFRNSISKFLRSSVRSSLHKIPFIKEILFLNDFVRLTRTWGMLLRSGVPILETLSASREVVFSQNIKCSIGEVSQKVVRGSRLQESIRQEMWFPSFAKNFLRIGEETGTLDESLDKIARFYERQLQGKLKIASALMEPLFILLVGLFVGGLVISLLLPIFEMSFVVR